MATKRLESLDILRGFDLFCLTALGPLIHAFERTGDYPKLETLFVQSEHINWTGLHVWDLVMPLFMFMAGVAIPFAFSKYRDQNQSKTKIYLRILKRVLVLWILGMICQGNLLEWNWSSLKFYSNTLQTIALGYAVAAIFFLNTKPKTQIICAICMLIGYFILMQFVTINGHGGGDYSKSGNLATYLDHVILGNHSDAVHFDENGVKSISRGNHTWTLASVNFSVTVMSGMFAGEILKSLKPEKQKMLFLSACGALMIGAGLLWSLVQPINKSLWTSSFVLVTSGIFFLLMALFYFMVDYKHWKGLGWLKVYGMNSIVAYMLSLETNVVDMKAISRSFLYGFQPMMSKYWYRFIIVLGAVIILYLILRLLYKHKIFVKA